MTRGLAIEDLGTPDASGRVDAVARRGGAEVARLQYAAWPDHLLVFEVHPAADGGEGAAIGIVEALLDRYPAPPARLTHYAIDDPATLRWYQAGPLAPGVVVAGYYGARAMSYDPIVCVDLREPPRPVVEGQAAACVVLIYDASLRTFGEIDRPTRGDAWTWLVEADVNSRTAAIRRFVLDARVAPEVARAAHHLALLNDACGVRQFAAIHMSGYTNDAHVEADVPALCALARDPWRAAADVGRGPPPDAGPSSLAQTRRNARYAIAWTLGNLAQTALGPAAPPWVKAAPIAAHALLRAEAGRPRPDAALRALVEAELGDDPVGRFGAGAPESLDLLDLLRFFVLRWDVIVRLGLKATDRFYWLVDTAAALLHGVAPDDPIARYVYAPPPDAPLPAVTELPPWIHGPNHYQSSEGA